jgi:hydroxyacylglutathione hydrolase
VKIDILETPELGDRSYVISDGRTAVVIDPQRDLDRLEPLLAEAGTVTHVLETHVHNDYLSGGLELARRTGAEYGVNAADQVAFERTPLRDGDVVTAGGLHISVIATPGHTDTHLAYSITTHGGGVTGTGGADGSSDAALFTGGSLLFGAVGRTDLCGPELTRPLSHAQYASAHRLALLPSSTRIFPTHGFGSFCSSGGASDATAATLADELQKNGVFSADSEDAFVDELIASLGAYPTYYAHMGPLNRTRLGAVDLAAPVSVVSPGEVRARIAAGEVVVDLRDRVAFAAGHLRGSTGITLGSQLATFVGWLVPFGAPLTLIASSRDDLEVARRQLARIGYDEITGTTAPVADIAPTLSFRRATYDDLAAELHPGDVVVDVRRAEERESGAIEGAVHIPLHELLARLDEIPPGRVWVHCVSGFRAGTAAGLLADAGRDVIQLDDHIDHAHTLGLVIT